MCSACRSQSARSVLSFPISQCKYCHELSFNESHTRPAGFMLKWARMNPQRVPVTPSPQVLRLRGGGGGGCHVLKRKTCEHTIKLTSYLLLKYKLYREDNCVPIWHNLVPRDTGCHLTAQMTTGLLVPEGYTGGGAGFSDWTSDVWFGVRGNSSLSLCVLSSSEDILSRDSGECSICIDELEQGDTIARLPCLCIYHKGWLHKHTHTHQ